MHEGCHHSAGALSFWTLIVQGGYHDLEIYLYATCLISSHSSPYLHAGLAKHQRYEKKDDKKDEQEDDVNPGRGNKSKNRDGETGEDRDVRRPRKKNRGPNDPKDRHFMICTFWGKLRETCATKSQAIEPAAY